MTSPESKAEEYIKSTIPLGHVRTSSDFFQEVQKQAFLAGYELSQSEMKEALVKKHEASVVEWVHGIKSIG